VYDRLASAETMIELPKSVNEGNVPIDVEVGGQALPALSRSARGADSAKESNAMTHATMVSTIE
jgi:hypothetical protein